jgi:hypothetical protein
MGWIWPSLFTYLERCTFTSYRKTCRILCQFSTNFVKKKKGRSKCSVTCSRVNFEIAPMGSITYPHQAGISNELRLFRGTQVNVTVRCQLWRMPSSDMLHRMALVRTDVSEEHFASMIVVTRIGELGTTLAVTSNRRTLRRNTYNSNTA